MKVQFQNYLKDNKALQILKTYLKEQSGLQILKSSAKITFFALGFLACSFLLFLIINLLIELFENTQESVGEKRFPKLNILKNIVFLMFVGLWITFITYLIYYLNIEQFQLFDISKTIEIKTILHGAIVACFQGFATILPLLVPKSVFKVFIVGSFAYFMYNLVYPDLLISECDLYEISEQALQAQMIPEQALPIVVLSFILNLLFEFDRFINYFIIALKKLFKNIEVFIPLSFLASIIITIQLAITNFIIYKSNNNSFAGYIVGFIIVIVADWSFNMVCNSLTVFLGSYLYQSNKNGPSLIKSYKIFQKNIYEICFGAFASTFIRILTSVTALNTLISFIIPEVQDISEYFVIFSSNLNDIVRLYTDLYFCKIAINKSQKKSKNEKSEMSFILSYFVSFKAFVFSLPLIIAFLATLFKFDFFNYRFYRLIALLSGNYAPSSSIHFFKSLIFTPTLSNYITIFFYIFPIILIFCISIVTITAFLNCRQESDELDIKELLIYKYCNKISLWAKEIRAFICHKNKA